MIAIISFDQYANNCRAELIEKNGNSEMSVPCDNCEDGIRTCHECDHEKECDECGGTGSRLIFPNEFMPERIDYYRQVFSDVVKYCGAMPGDFFENICNGISSLNQQWETKNWRSFR